MFQHNGQRKLLKKTSFRTFLMPFELELKLMFRNLKIPNYHLWRLFMMMNLHCRYLSNCVKFTINNALD